MKKGVPFIVTAGRETREGAGGIIYDIESGLFLLAKRSNGGDAAGTWACFGGGVDATDISLEHTVGREHWEEAGINVPMRLLKIGTVTYPDGFRFHNFLIIVEETPTITLNEEHTDYVWLAFDELMTNALKLNMHKGFMKAIDTDRFRELCFYELGLGNPDDLPEAAITYTPE